MSTNWKNKMPAIEATEQSKGLCAADSPDSRANRDGFDRGNYKVKDKISAKDQETWERAARDQSVQDYVHDQLAALSNRFSGLGIILYVDGVKGLLLFPRAQPKLASKSDLERFLWKEVYFLKSSGDLLPFPMEEKGQAELIRELYSASRYKEAT